MSQCGEKGDANSASIVLENRRSRLPQIAVLLSFSPILIFLSALLVSATTGIYLFGLIFEFSQALLFTPAGILFHVPAVTIATFAVLKRGCRREENVAGHFLSVIAILWSLFSIVILSWIWWGLMTGRIP